MARAAAASIPNRPDGPRTFPDRPYNLPTRPEVPLPGRGGLERHPPPLRHGDRRDGRDSRLPEPGRLDRPGDRPPREYPGRGMEPGPRDFGRPSERDRRPEPPPRWTGDSARENQERPGPRGSDQTGRLSRDGGMLPPPRMSTGDRGHPAGSEKAPPATVDRQEFMNTGISDTNTPPPRPESRNREDNPRERSRPQSPRRYGADRDHPDPRYDERPGRNGPTDVHISRIRQDDTQAPPAGPRSDRPADRPGERGGPERTRDAFQPAPPPQRAIDPNHGRLNSSSRQQADPNFGRLNAAPAPDIPSGPRDRNIRGNNRMVSAPQPRRDAGPRPPTPPEPSVPTGPSSTRHTRRAASGMVDLAPNTPATPTAASPAGIHPDRLKHLGHAGAPSEQHLPSPSEASPAGVHPDRLKAFADDASVTSNSQPSGNRSRPPMPSVVTQGPPARPMSSGGTGLPAPTGPASATERTMRGGRRQLAGINTMLQQAGQNNTPERMNVRGRGARMAGDTQPFSGPPTPNAHAPPGPPLSGRQERQEPREDLMNPPRADLITGNSPSDPRDRGRRERSGRHARRESRSPVGDRIREGKRGPGDDEREPGYREYRERKEGGRNEDRQGGGRDINRDIMPSTGRDDRERDRERGPSSRRSDVRSDVRERDPSDIRERDPSNIRERGPHDAPWVGGERGGDRSERGGGDLIGRGRERDLRGDDRREARGTRDDGSVSRKRRSEEGMADRGHDKRPRR